MDASSKAPLLTKLPKHAWYDVSRAPIIVVHFPDEFTNEELRGLLEASERWLLKEADGLFAYIADLRRPQALTAVQRKMIADSERACVPVDRKYNCGEAIVVSSPVMRGVVTVVSWFSSPQFPHKVVGSMHEAFAWVKPQFDKAVAEYPNGPTWRGRL